MRSNVYHGSPNGQIKELKTRVSTHQKKCIYATDRKVIALLFMGKGNGDLDTIKSIKDGKLEFVERRPNIKEGYLYELDGTSFEHHDYLWSGEVISFEESIEPLSVTHYPNILAAIEEEESLGNITIYRYPDRPEDVPLDNSDLIDKYISFEEQGLHGVVRDMLKIYPEFTPVVEEKLKQKGMKL